MPAVMQLEYATRSRTWRKRRIALSSGLLFLIILVSISYQPVMRRVRLLHWQRQCLTYSKPPGTLTLSPDPSRANDSDCFVPFNLPANVPQYAVSPQCWLNFKSEWGSAAPPSTPGRPRSEVIFLHEMISPAGNHRLVYVWFGTDNGLTFPKDLHFDVIAPATTFRDPKLISSYRRPTGIYFGSYYRVEAFFGQPDPKNPSHLTIQYGERGIVDGWLKDDETLVFARRQ